MDRTGSGTGEDRKRILVVEDDPEMRTVLVKALLAHGYRVFAVDNGADAEDRILNCPPDLVILDIMLPYKSGADICIELKCDARVRDVPVLVTTSLTDGSKLSAEQWREMTRADTFLPKPFSVSELISQVEEMLKVREQVRVAP